MKISFKTIEENVKEFKTHEAGVYNVQVVKAEFGESKNGTEFLKVEFETRGEDVFKVSHWFYNTPKALSILTNFLSAIGLYDKDAKKDINFDTDDVIGANLQVEFVKDDDDKYLVLKPWTCKAVEKRVKEEVIPF